MILGFGGAVLNAWVLLVEIVRYSVVGRPVSASRLTAVPARRPVLPARPPDQTGLASSV